MADIITPILNIVSVLCSCSANNRCCYLLDLKENREDLKNALEELRATRNDVKRRVDEAENNPNELMKRTTQVDSWLQLAQTTEGEVGEILEKVDQEIEGRCFGDNFPINCRNGRKIGKLVLRKRSIVNDLKSKGDFKEVAYKLPPPSVQEEPMNTTVGMESMFDKVWRLLADDEVRIMGLYGYGGVGKTTLLKQINNEFLKTTTTINTTTSSSSNNSLNGFDVVILVVVSKVINIAAIHEEIGKRLGLSSPDKTKIFNALSKKNFVLLLDDIWERVDLQTIGIPSSLENNKSKVVFTTRSETVCGLMETNKMLKVDCLPWEEAWSLFQEKVGERALNSFPRAHELAKVVARECAGLPLALITIGRAMSTKKTVQEWEHAITTLRRAASELPGMGEDVLSILKVSYDSLGNDTIKSCFLYCALFPEDHFIDIQKLVDYWIGEGFISLSDFHHIDEARNYGYDVIGKLKGACLLESGKDEETEVKMHDVIRDMALWITRDCGSSKKDKMLTIDAFDGRSERLWYNAERICLFYFRSDGTEVVLPTLKSPNLLTLIYKVRFGGLFIELPQNFFIYMPNLRVLDLAGMKTFPTSITGLLELRYLNLSLTSIFKLPKELGKLVKLEYLDLSCMRNLEEIPSGVIGSLLELRVLKLYGFCGADYWDLDELRVLKHLNELEISITTQHNLNKLLSNKNLQMCTRKLLLLFLETNMVMGIEQQQHLGRSCFQNLIDIQIRNCNGFKDLTWVGYVPKLKTLEVSYCEELEEIVIVVVDDFGESTGGDDIFKSLKNLLLMGLPKLKSICRNALAFPCLESLFVIECPQLKKLPLDSGSNVNNTLRKIRGGPKWWSELQWEEDHNNNELLKSKFLPYFEGDKNSDIIEEDESDDIVEEDESFDDESDDIVEEDESDDIVEEDESDDIVEEDESFDDESNKNLQMCTRRLDPTPRNVENPKALEDVSEKPKSLELDEVVDHVECQVVTLLETADPASKVARLLYTNSGAGILSLGSNGIQKLWKWGRNEQNPTGKATASVIPQHWQPNSGLLMINDISDVNLEEAVPCIALSKNDCYVMSAAGGRVSLFNMMTFKVMTTFMPPPPASTFLAFHPKDNNIVAIGMEDSTTHIYNVRVDEVKTKLKGHQKRITGLAFSTNLNILVSSGADVQLCTWNTDTWKKKKSVTLQHPSGKVSNGDTRVQFHSDQIRLLVCHETQLAIYDVSKMKCIRQWVPQDGLPTPVSFAAYSCNSLLVYAAFRDGNIGVFDAETLRLRCHIGPSAYIPQALPTSQPVAYPLVIATHPQEPNQLAVGLTDGSVKVIEPSESDGKWGMAAASASASLADNGTPNGRTTTLSVAAAASSATSNNPTPELQSQR